MLAIDASPDIVELARARLEDRADVWCQDVLELELAEPVHVIVSTAALHWVTDHERMWQRLAAALRPAGILEIQCGGAGNIARVREVIEAVARDTAPELVGWSPWEFASPKDTDRRLRQAGFGSIRCRLQEQPTYPPDLGPFVRTSILAAHLAGLPERRRDQFAADVAAGLRLPLDYVRLNISTIRTQPDIQSHPQPRTHTCGVWSPAPSTAPGPIASCRTIPCVSPSCLTVFDGLHA